MGIFDRLFGNRNANNNDLNVEKTSEMLEEDVYWKIISTAAKKYPDQEEQEAVLANQLSKLSPKDIVGFKLRTDQLLYDIYNAEMWCAAYIINGGCSDDGFEYFRCWVIAQGKEVYYQSRSLPDSLINVLNDETEEYEFESFLYAANDAFKEKTGKDLYDFIDDKNVQLNEVQKAIEFTWQEDKPETLKAICPLLFEAKWN